MVELRVSNLGVPKRPQLLGTAHESVVPNIFVVMEYVMEEYVREEKPLWRIHDHRGVASLY